MGIVDRREAHMSRGTFEDFTDKYGFEDGESIEPRDYQARDAICRGLNKLLKKHVVVPFDRSGMHNSCMILIFERREGWKDAKYLTGKVEPKQHADLSADLPDEFEIADLIDECYDEIDEGLDGEPYGQHVVAQFI